MVESNTWKKATQQQMVSFCIVSLSAAQEQKALLTGNKKNQSQQALSPKSNDGSTLTDLQPSCPLRSILVTAPLPPLLEPPVSSTCPGPTEEVAIPSPSMQTGVGRTLRAMWLQDGQMDGTGDTEGKQTNKTSQSHKRHNW